MVKNLPADVGYARDGDSIPRWGRSSGGGNGNPLQCFCLDSPWPEEPGESTGLQKGDTAEHEYKLFFTNF